MRTTAITYPPELPVSQRRGEIAEAIRDHQVVVVAGETGSGKTTQLPKICLELGRGVAGMIGHTQPRRLAARTVAERVAAELGTELGRTVGYQVRFTDRVGRDTQVKLMTDGILLAELERDRSLRRYDTIILDEAHERSLNVDFLLGYLARLLPHRPDLKLIITSATIDPERFSRHFGGAPVVEVSGRTYPVEVRYRPLGEDADDDRDQAQGILDAVDELCREGPGDILVFLSGEREIRDTAEALRGHDFPRSPGGVEVLPLYARLAAGEQHRVFQAHTGRRVVLATNVAETSLTVPGVKYVVDPGTARISRYSHRSKVQRLPIEPVSQASANQRKGRCGRTSDGICIRLYSEDDFASRPEFTEPEILRTNLASVILQMTSLRLGDIARFPFIDPPDRRSVKDGLDLLGELGALDGGRLTRVGRRLAQIPADPRLARMLLEAGRLGCAREVLVIVAALSIQDPRERPADKQERADELHRRFADQRSDFLTWLNLWRYLHERQAELSSNQFRKLCRAEFLNYLRVREWQDLHGQLRSVARDLGIRRNPPTDEPDADRVHTALLAGLLSHIGLKQGDTREYLGARGTRFAIFPGLGAGQEAAAVGDGRRAGRDLAAVGPGGGPDRARVGRGPGRPPGQAELRRAALVEVAGGGHGHRAGHPVRDPAGRRPAGQLRPGRPRGGPRAVPAPRPGRGRLGDLAPVLRPQPAAAGRGRGAGAPGPAARHPGRRPHPVRLLRPAHPRRGRLGPPLRRLVEAGQPGPARPARLRAVDADRGGRRRPRRRRLPRHLAPGRAPAAPELPVRAGQRRRRRHRPHPPGRAQPGRAGRLRLAGPRAPPRAGHRADPVAAQGDPPQLHPGAQLGHLGPVADRPGRRPAARGPWPRAGAGRAGRGPARGVRPGQGARPPADDLPGGRPGRPGRRGRGPARVVGEGKDLDELKQRLAPRVRAAIAAAAPGLERDRVTTWDLGTLPRVVEEGSGGRAVKGFPALVEEDGRVAVRLLETEAEQAAAMWAGTRRLLLEAIPSPVKFVLGRQTNQAKLTLSRYRHGSATDLFADCLAAAADDLIAANGGPAWDEAGFGRLLAAVRGELAGATLEVVSGVERVLAVAGEVEGRLAELANPVFAPAAADVRAQLDDLIYPGWVTATGRRRLPDVLRYVRAMQLRLDRLPGDLAADADRMESVARVTDAWRRAAGRPPATRPDPAALAEIRWMLEELRVSYFAQSLGTAHPVSEKRVLRAIDRLGG